MGGEGGEREKDRGGERKVKGERGGGERERESTDAGDRLLT